jgi:hypothetical protein
VGHYHNITTRRQQLMWLLLASHSCIQLLSYQFPSRNVIWHNTSDVRLSYKLTTPPYFLNRKAQGYLLNPNSDMPATTSKANSSKSNGKRKIEDTESQSLPKKLRNIARKQIILNAFDMSGTIGHLSPGQWKVFCVLLLTTLTNH